MASGSANPCSMALAISIAAPMIETPPEAAAVEISDAAVVASPWECRFNVLRSHQVTPGQCTVTIINISCKLVKLVRVQDDDMVLAQLPTNTTILVITGLRIEYLQTQSKQ